MLGGDLMARRRGALQVALGGSGARQDGSAGAGGSAGMTDAATRGRVRTVTQRVRGAGRFALQPSPDRFTPWKPATRPPTGTYDPNLDAQERAAIRGFSDLGEDTTKANRRSQDDYLLARGDLATSLTRGAEDYMRSVGQMDRSYQRLGNSQLQAARQAGVSEGGTLADALAKRQANEAWDRAPVDQSWGRMQQDNQRSQGQLGLQLGRQVEDRTDTLSRAGRELGFFKADVGNQRFYQARQTGFVPASQGPAGEHPVAGGGAYRDVGSTGQSIRLPSGRVLSNIGNPRLEAEFSRLDSGNRQGYQAYLAWAARHGQDARSPMEWVRGGKKNIGRDRPFSRTGV